MRLVVNCHQVRERHLRVLLCGRKPRVAEQFPGVIAQDLWALTEQQKMMDLGDTHYPGEMHLRSDTGLLKAREIVRAMAGADVETAAVA